MLTRVSLLDQVGDDDHSPDEILQRTIHSLRREFHSILRGDSTAFGSFLDKCMAVNDFIQSHRESVKEETIGMLQDLSTSFAAIGPSMLELGEKRESLNNQFTSNMMDILAGGMEDMQLGGKQHPATRPAIPPYAEPCARWLKDHWFDPYPSQQFRAQIARQTQTSTKDIDAWFCDIRKRIGWNDLRRTRFNNKRADIRLAAMHSITSPEPLPGQPDFSHHFATIKSNAEEYYRERFAKTQLAEKLDAAVKDLTPDLKERLREQKAKEKRQARRSDTMRKAATAVYPSPDASSLSTADLNALPSLDLDHVPLKDIHSLPLCLKKKRSFSSDPAGEDSTLPRSKRRRLSLAAGLPSPTLSAQGDLFGHHSFEPVSPNERPSTKRKRPLSSNHEYAPQSPHSTPSTPTPSASSASPGPSSAPSSVVETTVITSSCHRRKRQSAFTSNLPLSRRHQNRQSAVPNPAHITSGSPATVSEENTHVSTSPRAIIPESSATKRKRGGDAGDFECVTQPFPKRQRESSSRRGRRVQPGQRYTDELQSDARSQVLFDPHFLPLLSSDGLLLEEVAQFAAALEGPFVHASFEAPSAETPLDIGLAGLPEAAASGNQDNGSSIFAVNWYTTLPPVSLNTPAPNVPLFVPEVSDSSTSTSSDPQTATVLQQSPLFQKADSTTQWSTDFTSPTPVTRTDFMHNLFDTTNPNVPSTYSPLTTADLPCNHYDNAPMYKPVFDFNVSSNFATSTNGPHLSSFPAFNDDQGLWLAMSGSVPNSTACHLDSLQRERKAQELEAQARAIRAGRV